MIALIAIKLLLILTLFSFPLIEIIICLLIKEKISSKLISFAILGFDSQKFESVLVCISFNFLMAFNFVMAFILDTIRPLFHKLFIITNLLFIHLILSSFRGYFKNLFKLWIYFYIYFSTFYLNNYLIFLFCFNYRPDIELWIESFSDLFIINRNKNFVFGFDFIDNNVFNELFVSKPKADNCCDQRYRWV